MLKSLVVVVVIGRFMYMFDVVCCLLCVWLLNNVWLCYCCWCSCFCCVWGEKERKLGAAITKSESERAFCKLIDPTAGRVGDYRASDIFLLAE